MIWDELLQTVRAELTRRNGEASERSTRIAAALDAYLRAHEHRLATQFAERNGLPAPAPAEEVEVAALRLRELVLALPELGAASAMATAAPDPAATAPAPPRPARRETMELLTLDEAKRQLATEFDAARFASMRLEEFLLHAEEFAAAARALQERTGGDPLSQRLIRRLTALVHERELPRKIFGLSRYHSADWQQLANDARARRLAAEARRGTG